MAYDSLNKRLSALNGGVFGILRGLYIPLRPSGGITEDDTKNNLGVYVGVEVPEISTVEPVEKIYGSSTIVRDVYGSSVIVRDVYGNSTIGD